MGRIYKLLERLWLSLASGEALSGHKQYDPRYCSLLLFSVLLAQSWLCSQEGFLLHLPRWHLATSSAVVLNLGWFFPLGDIWQCQRHFWLSELGRRGRMLLTSWYIEAKNTQDRSPQQRIIQSQMSIVLRLRNPDPGQHAFSSVPSREDRICVPEFPRRKIKSGLEQFDKSQPLLKRHFLSFVTEAFSLHFPLSPGSLLCWQT